MTIPCEGCLLLPICRNLYRKRHIATLYLKCDLLNKHLHPNGRTCEYETYKRTSEFLLKGTKRRKIKIKYE